MTSLHDQQIAFELNFTNDALAASANAIAEAMQAGNLDRIPAADAVVARLFSVLREKLEPVVTAKTRGPGAALRGWLRAVPLDTLTLLTLRSCLNRTLYHDQNATVQVLAIGLGQDVVNEALIQKAAAVNDGYVKTTWDYLKKAGTTDARHIHKTMRAVVRNVLGEQDEHTLSSTEYIQIGKHCLQAMLDAGILVPNRTTNRTGTLVVFELEESIHSTLRNSGAGFIRAAAPAMLAPPEPWSGINDGGYLTADLRLRYPLSSVNRARPLTRRLRREGMGEAGPVLACANYLQGHAFRVHKGVFEHLLRVWTTGGGVLGVPRRDDPPKPEFPFPEGWDATQAPDAELEVFASWKRSMARWYTAQKHHRSTVAEVASLIAASRKHDGDLYFPAMVDFRGRYYYRGNPNPQGTDIAKGILHFSEKRPLGPRGVYWLKVSIANSFGFDKVRFDKRAEWVDHRLEALRVGLEAPEDSDLYRSADSPFCAIAAATELFAALDSGNPEAYETGIPVHMDATCSGLQHFSALLRDPVGARFTNLTPTQGDTKEDIYMHVAGLAKARVRRDAADVGCKDQLLAQLWLDIEITRNLAKKPVMTYPYGATARGVADFVGDYLLDLGWAVEGVSSNQMGMYMGRVLFAAVEATVPAAAACMRWLRDRVGDAARDAPLVWHTPARMRVVQDYQDCAEKRVDIRSCGLAKIIVREYLPTTKPTTMRNAVSPNFVHGLDAAHLTFTALRMQREGHCLVGIHDSFGTHPSAVDAMHAAIREEFVAMYQQDILTGFLNDIGQTDVSLPPTGTLDLDLVNKSEFFFC